MYRFYVDNRLVQTSFYGSVIDIGGRKTNKVGQFIQPEDQVSEWKYLNINPENSPDFLCSADEIPVKSETFDIVLLSEVLEHLEQPYEVLNEIYRVLKPGGSVIMVDSLNNNPIFRFNRYIHYLRGNSSKSTIVQMPTISLIIKYTEKFGYASVKFFGAITWIFPLLSKILSEQMVANISNWVDAKLSVERSAFKFVIILVKK